jgi:hypothetical protein
MEKMSKSSIDADRRIMAKSRNCTAIHGIEAFADGTPKRFDRSMYNDRQWHSLFVYCWSHKEDFDFDYRAGVAENPRAMTESQMAKLGIEIENDDSIVMKHKAYGEDELKNMRIKALREICIAKGVPDDGDKRAMIDAILEVQKIQED